MRWSSSLGLVVLLAAGFTSADDTDATTISSAGCVAPSDFEDCLNGAVTSETQCVAEFEGGGAEETADCGIIYYIDQMQCYMESCWNKVYSCEYQALVFEYQSERALTVPEEVPFWPAPDGAPGGCSFPRARASVNVELASFYGICPTTDLDDLIGSFIADIEQYETTLGRTCADVLASTNCLTDWGFGSAYGGVYPDPAVSLPPNGTEPLYTTAGSLTSPPGGATLTWSLLGAVRTAIASPYNAKNAQATTAAGSAATAAETGLSGLGTAAVGSSGLESATTASSGARFHTSKW
ncbi:hypothetical protein MBLNU459_g5531t2 [Dothideomycetes sp. NU459]